LSECRISNFAHMLISHTTGVQPRTFRSKSGCQPNQVRGGRRGVLVHCPPNAEELVWVTLRGNIVGTGITSFRKDPDDGRIRSPTVCG
jgi:hypothetical protein